ncbi:MAG: hypothetical protein QM622_10060 [Microbacterium sp.]
MGSFLEYSPWARQSRSRRPFTAFASRVLVVLAVAIAGLTLPVLLLVAGTMAASPEWQRIAVQSTVALLGVVLFLGIAYLAPTYRFVTVTAGLLDSGSPLVMRAGPIVCEVCTVSRVFVHHGRQPPLACIGLVDGRDVDWPLATELSVAVPYDLFHRFRNRSPSGRVPPTQPSEPVTLALAAIWDTRLRLREDEIAVHELAEEYASTFPEQWSALDLEQVLAEAADLRLLRRRRRGIGRRQKEYVEMTGLGYVTLSAEMREREIEIHTDAGKEIPVTTINNNSGIIITGSPGASANIGSGHAVSGIPLEVVVTLRRIADAPDALAAGDDDALRQRIDDLAHELAHPNTTESRLRRAAAAVADVGAAAIAGFLGNAAWGALSAWLGLPPRDGG